MGRASHRAVVGVLVVGIGTTACGPGELFGPPRPDSGFAPVDCVVDDDPDAVLTAEQALVAEAALVRIPPPAIEVFLEEDSGGPLRCRPSGQPCPALEGCVGDPVPVPIGTEATLAVGLRVHDDYIIRALIESIAFATDSDPAFRVLLPAPDAIEGEPVSIFVAVTPTVEGVIAGQLEIVSDARNTEGEPLRVTLQVEGVQP